MFVKPLFSFFVFFYIMAQFIVATENGLSIETTFKPPQCDGAHHSTKGDKLSMHYVGTIDESSDTGEKGVQFDSSRGRGRPFEFTLGVGQVIQGWDEGLLDMCIGEKRTLIVPPSLGYGSKGFGQKIPPGATLRFEVECVSLGKPNAQANVFSEMDSNGDAKISYDEFEAWFKKNGQTMPPQLWAHEDKNQDRYVSWNEFTGPKGDKNPADEL